jgi:hypothetical protein
MTFTSLHTHYRGASADELAKRWLNPNVEYILFFLALMSVMFVVWVNVKDTALGETLGWGDEKVAAEIVDERKTGESDHSEKGKGGD